MSEDWTDDAACRDLDPELFFPLSEEDVGTIRRAKTVCATCPVWIPCLTEAFRSGEDHGIWGGYTEEERRKMRQVELLRQRGLG